jgi:uncharacterized protein YbjT (DUF2867 family)
MTVLAVGAAGEFASLVIPELNKRGALVRGLVRKPDQIDVARRNGAGEFVVGDLRDQPSLDAALCGIEAVFYIAPAFLQDEAEVGERVVEAAVRADVRRFVFSSVIHPVLTSLSHHAAKIVVENAVLNSGLEYTFLHPARFFQNYTRYWPEIVKTGVLAEPWSANTRFSRVDYRDVAEVGAIALTEDKLLYGTFELCAPGTLNGWDVGRLVEQVTGRTIRVEKRDIETLGKIPDLLRAMFEYYDHHSLLGNSLTLRTILGREPREYIGWQIRTPE